MRFRPSRVGNRFACLVVAARNRTSHMERRNFLKIVAAGVAIASTKLSTKLRSAVAADNPNPSGASAKPNGSIPYRTLGHTGEKVSIVGIGGGQHDRRVGGRKKRIEAARPASEHRLNVLENSSRDHKRPR